MECYWLFLAETEWRGYGVLLVVLGEDRVERLWSATGYGVLLVVLGEDRVVRIWSAAGCSRRRPSGEAMECYWLF